MGLGLRQPPLSRLVGQELPCQSPRAPVVTVMGCVMADIQTIDLILFAAGTFAAALVTGVAGIVVGIRSAPVWRNVLPHYPPHGLDLAIRLHFPSIRLFVIHLRTPPTRLLH